ncbi:hypothetical protein C2G38_2153874 [Gigaspora rosea]|uniref:Uncharacterized protein n=1 Tax=Gigaspora rosea TaxID=44941 RepID=A0A397W7I9_9GLOM|nr:hypothetical protein C2G38_2153874 [Gigaspora rosea]
MCSYETLNEQENMFEELIKSLESEPRYRIKAYFIMGMYEESLSFLKFALKNNIAFSTLKDFNKLLKLMPNSTWVLKAYDEERRGQEFYELENKNSKGEEVKRIFLELWPRLKFEEGIEWSIKGGDKNEDAGSQD